MIFDRILRGCMDAGLLRQLHVSTHALLSMSRLLVWTALFTLQSILASSTMTNHTVFVYGTLKTGEPNNHLFDANKKEGEWELVGKGTTVEKYPLIIGTKYNIPFLLYSPGNGTNVEGEIYRVDDKMLKALDQLEEHPNFYEREVKEIKLANNGTTVSCWIYFLKKFRPELLSQTVYSNYSSLGNHGLVYVDRYLRDPNSSAKAHVYLNEN